MTTTLSTPRLHPIFVTDPVSTKLVSKNPNATPSARTSATVIRSSASIVKNTDASKSVPAQPKLNARQVRHPFWLFVDTALTPTQHPIPTLGNMENQRRVPLPDVLLQLSEDEQISHVCKLIAQHHQSHPRGLSFWGDIQRYCFCQVTQQGTLKKIWFTPDGQRLNI